MSAYVGKKNLSKNAHYVNVAELAWEKTKLPGAERKVLFSNPAPDGTVPGYRQPHRVSKPAAFMMDSHLLSSASN